MLTYKIKVTLVKSTIGFKQDQIATVKALGLKKIRDEKIHEATPAIKATIKPINTTLAIVLLFSFSISTLLKVKFA